MNDNHDNQTIIPAGPSFIERVMNNEATKKGVAAAGAGILVAIISEVLWPTR